MEFLQDTNVWVAFSFIAFMILAFKFGKTSVLNMLDEKIEAIKTELETAESLRVEAKELLAQYQRKQRDAMKESEQIVATAKTQAEEFQKQSENDLQDLMDRRELQLEARLTRMEESAIKEMHDYAGNLAINAASKLIADTLDKKTDEALIEKSIANISKNIH